MVLDMVLQFLDQFTVEENRKVISAAKAAVARQLAGAGPSEPDACPRCGSGDFVKKGMTGGSQRWLCKSCGRTFSAKTMGLLAYSKLPAETWAAYVEASLSGKTLAECAEACDVCLRTSWFMRMRLCEVMGATLQPFRSGETVSWQVDGTYLDESLKGNRARSREPMPRGAHRHGGSVHERGISNLKVCVVCGANGLGDSFCRLADRGRPSDAAVEGSLEGLVGGCAVTTDGHQAHGRVLPKLGAGAHEATSSSGLGLVNALHKRLKGFLARFNGVSTRWLGHYLSWFCWTEQARRSDADEAETCSGQAAAGRYGHTRRQLVEEPQPFWDYWCKSPAMSTVV